MPKSISKLQGMPWYLAADSFHAVGFGIPMYSPWLIRGHLPASANATDEDIWEEGGTMTYLTSAESININSTDAADAAAGTGLRTVRVTYLDASWELKTADVTLDGTNNVSLGDTAYRIESILGLTCGSGNTNAGTIKATSVTSSAVQARMDIGEALSQDAHFTIPAGYSGQFTHITFESHKLSGGQQPLVEIKAFYRTGAGAPWVLLFDTYIDTSLEDGHIEPVDFHPAFQAQTDIRFVANSNQANTEVRVYGYMILKEDDQ